MNYIRYAILVDEGTQWYSCLAELFEEDGTSKLNHAQQLTRKIETTPFCRNILDRPYAIKNLDITIESFRGFYGWYLSKKEFKQIEKMISLEESVNQFEKLAEVC